MAENTLSPPSYDPTADVASTLIPDSTAVKSRKRARQIEGDEDEETASNTGPKGTRTGRKRELKFVVDPSRREQTFSRGKVQLMKMAWQLAVLTGAPVMLLLVSDEGVVHTFTTPKLEAFVQMSEGQEMIKACLNAPDPSADQTLPAGEHIMDSREGTPHIELEHQAAGQQRPAGIPLVADAHPALDPCADENLPAGEHSMDSLEGTPLFQLEHQAAGQQMPSGIPLFPGAHPAYMNMSQSTQSQPQVALADMNRLHVQADSLAISEPRAAPYGAIEGQDQAQPDANTCNYFMQHQQQQVGGGGGGGGHRELYGRPMISQRYPPLNAWNPAAPDLR